MHWQYRVRIEQEGVPTRVQTAIEMQKVAEPFIVRRETSSEKNRCNFKIKLKSFIFQRITAALRASEIGADDFNGKNGRRCVMMILRPILMQ